MTDEETGAFKLLREHAENIVTPAELAKLAMMSRSGVSSWIRRDADFRERCVIADTETTTLIYWPAAKEWLIDSDRNPYDLETLNRGPRGARRGVKGKTERVK